MREANWKMNARLQPPLGKEWSSERIWERGWKESNLGPQHSSQPGRGLHRIPRLNLGFFFSFAPWPRNGGWNLGGWPLGEHSKGTDGNCQLQSAVPGLRQG